MKNKITKYAIDIFSTNGKAFFRNKLPSLRLKDENSFHNVSSPFRRDRNPSFHVYRNPSDNKWYYKDWGDSSSTGDVYSFAASIYGLSLQSDFPLIIKRMFYDLKLHTVDSDVFRVYSNTDAPFVTFEVGESALKEELNNDRSSYSGHNARMSYSTASGKSKLVSIDKKSIKELSVHEQNFLATTGINIDVMEKNNTYFIKGYKVAYDEFDEQVKSVPTDSMWIAYKHAKGCKIYQPYPTKKFWWVGLKPKEYVYGSSNIVDSPLDFTFLVGGEKDVLSLQSRGYNAMCLNSETQSIDYETKKSWYIDRLNIVVMYDNDDTGMKQASKCKSEHGYATILLPSENGVKDITDYFVQGGTNESFELLVSSQIKTINTDIAPTRKSSFRTAKERLNDARKLPPTRQYLDVLFHTNELCIFFGDTGIGKSIFAVGLANAISNGISFVGLNNDNPPARVLYIDFELTDRQFRNRYTTKDGDEFPFSDNLYIDNIDLSSYCTDNAKEFESKLISGIEQLVDEVNAEVLILDNITFLSMGPTEDSKVALSLIKPMLELKKRKGISILLLAHTPKKYGVGGLSIADVAGSKLITNFVDGVFAIGKSKNDKDLRYIKQIKTRGGEMKYDSSNVIVLEIDKVDQMLTFSCRGYEQEKKHIFEYTESPESQEKKIKEAQELRKQGMSYREIASTLNTSKSTVDRWLKSSTE